MIAGFRARRKHRGAVRSPLWTELRVGARRYRLSMRLASMDSWNAASAARAGAAHE